MSTINNFDSLVELQKKLIPIADYMSKSTYSEVDEYIHTGSFIFNACISGKLKGGIPVNKVVAFAGDSQTSKTVSCLNVARNAQKMGYNILYYDTENAVTKSMMESFGVDTSKVLYTPLSIVEDLKYNIVTLLNTLIETKDKGEEVPKILIIIDSLSQLGTKKLDDDASAGKNTVDMTRARGIKNLFQLITNKLGYLKYPLIFTSHTYSNMDAFAKAHEKIKLNGGKSLEYTASVIVHFSRTQLEEDKGKSEKSGITVIAQALKNRLVQQKKIKYHIPWKGEINPYVGLEKFIEVTDKKLAQEIWDKVGIGRGTLSKDKKTKKIVFEFKPKSTTWAVRHLEENVKRSDSKRIFSDEIFTPEVIDNLDYFVYKEFSFGEDTNYSGDEYIENLNSYLDELSSEDLI